MTTAQDIRIGDSIFPPEREMRLWMRRNLVEKGLGSEALKLKVVEVYEGKPDKKGRWIEVKGQYGSDWTKTYSDPDRAYFMTFKARPETPWMIFS